MNHDERNTSNQHEPFKTWHFIFDKRKMDAFTNVSCLTKGEMKNNAGLN